MKKLAVSFIAPLCVMISFTDVQAHSRRSHSSEGRSPSAYRYVHSVKTRAAHSRHARRSTYGYTSAGSIGARPSKWCGWWMRTQLGGGPEFNLAWNWSKYGRPASAQVGAIVVWPHHVGMITGRAKNGQWIVKSGNDGNRVRERPRSVAGAVFRMGTHSNSADAQARRVSNNS